MNFNEIFRMLIMRGKNIAEWIETNKHENLSAAIDTR